MNDVNPAKTSSVNVQISVQNVVMDTWQETDKMALEISKEELQW